jgi:hypothetical protein
MAGSGAIHDPSTCVSFGLASRRISTGIARWREPWDQIHDGPVDRQLAAAGLEPGDRMPRAGIIQGEDGERKCPLRPGTECPPCSGRP